MTYVPNRYRKFQIEIYKSGWAYSNQNSNFRRLFISPEDRFSSGISSAHYKIINEIPENISTSHLSGDGMYALKNGVYIITLECAKSWDTTKTTAPEGQAERFSVGKWSGSGSVTHKTTPITRVLDTSSTVSTGYKVLDYYCSQIIEVTNSSNGCLLECDYGAPNSRVNPSDPNTQQMYKWVCTAELIENQTV